MLAERKVLGRQARGSPLMTRRSEHRRARMPNGRARERDRKSNIIFSMSEQSDEFCSNGWFEGFASSAILVNLGPNEHRASPFWSSFAYLSHEWVSLHDYLLEWTSILWRCACRIAWNSGTFFLSPGTRSFHQSAGVLAASMEESKVDGVYIEEWESLIKLERDWLAHIPPVTRSNSNRINDRAPSLFDALEDYGILRCRWPLGLASLIGKSLWDQTSVPRSVDIS